MAEIIGKRPKTLLRKQSSTACQRDDESLYSPAISEEIFSRKLEPPKIAICPSVKDFKTSSRDEKSRSSSCEATFSSRSSISSSSELDELFSETTVFDKPIEALVSKVSEKDSAFTAVGQKRNSKQAKSKNFFMTAKAP